MATKPGATFTIATNLNYTAGDRIGSPTKIAAPDIPNGSTPGTDATPEMHNYMNSISGAWGVWLLAGDFAPILAAHVVEADSSGQVGIASLNVGGTASGDLALVVQQNTGADSAAATISNSSVAGFGLIVSAAGALATIRATQTGGGYCFETNNLGTNSGGGKFTGRGSAEGVKAVAGPTGSGLIAERDAAGGPAVECTQDGGGVPVRGILFVEPTNDPSAPVDGDVWKAVGTTGFGRGALKFRDDDGGVGGGSAGDLKVWASPGGRGFESAESLGDTTESVSTITDKLTLTLDNVGSPGHPDGDYIIEFYCAIRIGAGGVPLTVSGASPGPYAIAGTIAEVEFHGPSGLLTNLPFEIDFRNLGQNKPVSFSTKVAFSGGPSVFTIKFRSQTGGGEGVTIADARIIARGTYD